MRNQNPVVFVVDDEKVIAETLAMILNRAGFSAFPFEDPLAALAAAESGAPPSLLVSDVVMPGMSGVELGVQFHHKFPACKVLLFSGQAATANMLEAARAQGYEFELLTKPVHPADLIAKLRAPAFPAQMRTRAPLPLSS